MEQGTICIKQQFCIPFYSELEFANWLLRISPRHSAVWAASECELLHSPESFNTGPHEGALKAIFILAIGTVELRRETGQKMQFD